MTGDAGLLFKAVLLVSIMAALYVHLVFFTPPTGWALLECALLGCTIAAIGFNVMHDGAHGSFSRFSWMNKLAAYTLAVLSIKPTSQGRTPTM